jgi:ketosteroid isomerase-like protein
MILDDFFAAAAAFDEEALAAVVHPDVRISEMPNAINKDGTERDRAAALAAFRRGREIVAEQSYDVHEVLVAGDTIAARATWRGRLADGPQLTAHIATFTEVRDGRIYRHATYDCYEPLS